MKAILKSLFVIGLVGALAAGATTAYFSDEETSTGNVFKAGTIDLDELEQTVMVFEDIKPCQDLVSTDITFRNVGQNEGNLTFEYTYVEGDKEEDNDPDTFEFAANAAGEGHNTLPATGNPGLEMYPEQLAKLMYVESSSQDGCNNLANLVAWADGMYGNNDGKASLYELAQAPAKWYDMKDSGVCITTYPTDDVFDVGQTSTVTIKFHLAHAFVCSDSDAYTGNMHEYENSCSSGGYKIYTGDPVAWNVPQADGISLTLTATLTQLMD